MKNKPTEKTAVGMFIQGMRFHRKKNFRKKYQPNEGLQDEMSTERNLTERSFMSPACVPTIFNELIVEF